MALLPRTNLTIPGRFHLIVRSSDRLLYVTLWLFGKRYHYCNHK